MHEANALVNSPNPNDINNPLYKQNGVKSSCCGLTKWSTVAFTVDKVRPRGPYQRNKFVALHESFNNYIKKTHTNMILWQVDPVVTLIHDEIAATFWLGNFYNIHSFWNKESACLWSLAVHRSRWLRTNVFDGRRITDKNVLSKNVLDIMAKILINFKKFNLSLQTRN